METGAQTIASVRAKGAVLRQMLAGRVPGEICPLSSTREFIAWSITDDLLRLRFAPLVEELANV